MDLPAIRTILTPRRRDDLPPAAAEIAFLGGGTWLFSEPQPGLHTLVDLLSFRWPSIEERLGSLRLSATCTIAELAAYAGRQAWPATHLFPQCARALAASFKVCNVATLGGNVCLALPSASLVALVIALDGVAEIWRADGTSYHLAMERFVLDSQRTALQPGDLLRAIELPLPALQRRAAFRQTALWPQGRSAALLIATQGDSDTAISLTITASTRRPIVLRWPQLPTAPALDQQLAELPASLWLDDMAGRPAWRRHITRLLAQDLIQELAA